MKTTLIILLLGFVSLFSFAGKTLTGDSNTILNQYQVTQVGENLYELTYSNSGATFTIEVCKQKRECCYLLRNENIEVMYLCNGDGFGMRKMPEKLKKIDTSVYKQLINPDSFQQQSLLTTNKKDEKQALGLIACFFPNAINANSFNKLFKVQNTVDRPELTIKQ
jgi:hypothetical protein